MAGQVGSMEDPEEHWEAWGSVLNMILIGLAMERRGLEKQEATSGDVQRNVRRGRASSAGSRDWWRENSICWGKYQNQASLK